MAGNEPPLVVDLVIDASSVSYRLIHHPCTHRPALDHLGNYLYMAVAPAAAASGDNRARSSMAPVVAVSGSWAAWPKARIDLVPSRHQR